MTQLHTLNFEPQYPHSRLRLFLVFALGSWPMLYNQKEIIQFKYKNKHVKCGFTQWQLEKHLAGSFGGTIIWFSFLNLHLLLRPHNNNKKKKKSKMESDSDSDGSHVSATPPREASPPPLRLPKKSLIRAKPPKSKKLPPRPAKAPLETDPKTYPNHGDSFCLPTSLPFQIRRSSDSVPTLSTSHSMETLPAGFFSKSVSFSKIRRTFVDLEASGNEPLLNSVCNPASDVHIHQGKQGIVLFVALIRDVTIYEYD